MLIYRNTDLQKANSTEMQKLFFSDIYARAKEWNWKNTQS